jgi:hypothetical protein
MGFGGATIGTVSVDVVQTDVQAIVDGIAGGHTLADISTQLQTLNYNLSDGGYYSSIYSQLNLLRQSVDAVTSCLRNDSYGRTAMDCLLNMEYYLDQIRGNPYPNY